MSELYPPIERTDHGLLNTGDGHLIYWETSGNPNGKPVVALHGGPGSGSSPTMRRYFDPARWRIVLFDQRNCGHSLPHASDPAVDLSTNTTPHLIADMERLRAFLEIDRWAILGRSWGSTLALAYAQQHPDRVTGMVLVGVTTTRRSEIDWLYHGVGRYFPAEWEAFRDGAPPDQRGDLVAAYHRLLNNPDPGAHAQAALDWHTWEAFSVSVNPGAPPNPLWQQPDYRLARARIITHYFVHNAWLHDGILLRNAHRLTGIPGVLIHGRLDLGSPLITAWELHRAWPGSDLIIVDEAGHSSGDPGMTEALIAATDRLARP